MNILIIASQQFPGTTDTSLYLICNEQDIMLFAEVVAPAEITVIGNNYACLLPVSAPTGDRLHRDLAMLLPMLLHYYIVL